MAIKASRVIRVFVIVAIALATSLLLYLLINNFQFTRGLEIKVHFTQIGDLNKGAWVRKSGLKVGSVTRLEPDVDETTIIVTLTFKPGQTARRADQFALVAKGILGDMYIEQKPGPKDSPPAEQGMRFEGIPSFNITDLLGGDTMNMITDLAGSIKGIVEILKNSQDVLASSLKDIAKTAENVRLVTDRAVILTEDVPTITRQITSSIDQLQSAVSEVTTATRTVVTRLEGTVDTGARDLSSSLSAIRQTTTDIQTAVSKLTAQESIISRLGSPATAESLTAAVKNLEEVSKGLLAVTADAKKITEGVRSILEQ
jgi:ABC-type transporter Mla subunit MlaD